MFLNVFPEKRNALEFLLALAKNLQKALELAKNNVENTLNIQCNNRLVCVMPELLVFYNSASFWNFKFLRLTSKYYLWNSKYNTKSVNNVAYKSMTVSNKSMICKQHY